MLVRIGSIELEVAVPDDLDSRLNALTGLDAAATREVLKRTCGAGEVAAALAPLLTEPLHRVELARMIAASDAGAVRREVLAVYEAIETKGPARRGKTKA